jgi:hypothetical protein
LALILVGGGVSLLTLALIQGRFTQAIVAPRAVPLQVVALLGYAAVLWGVAFLRFRRGFQYLRRPLRAARPLFEATGLNIAALYLTGFAIILAHTQVLGDFPFDIVNLVEVTGLVLLGVWLSGWGGYDLTLILRSHRRQLLVRLGQTILSTRRT